MVSFNCSFTSLKNHGQFRARAVRHLDLARQVQRPQEAAGLVQFEFGFVNPFKVRLTSARLPNAWCTVSHEDA